MSTGSDDAERERTEREQRRWEQEHALRVEELKLKAREGSPSLWKSPLALSIAAAAITLLGNALLSAYNATTQSHIEKLKLQSELIKKFTEPTDVQARIDNLAFLAKSGLIPDYQEKIQTYLRENPGRAPRSGELVPAPASDRTRMSFGDFSVKAIQDPSVDIRFRTMSRSVGRLFEVSDAKRVGFCIAFLIAPDQVVTGGFCTAGSRRDIAVEFNECSPGTAFKLIGPPVQFLKSRQDPDAANVAVHKLEQPVPAACGQLTLERQAPVQQTKVGLIYIGGDGKAYLSTDNECVIGSVTPDLIKYRCDDEQGSAGAPVISLESGKVVAVHLFGNQESSGGLRASLIQQ